MSYYFLFCIVIDKDMLFSKGLITRKVISKSVMRHLSTLAKISPTRFTDIEVYATQANNTGLDILKLFFTLRAKVLLTSG